MKTDGDRDSLGIAASLAEIIIELGTNPTLSRFNALAQELVRAVIRDIEIPVRSAIAARLASEPHIPRTIVRILANDEIEVAWPILAASTVLADEDLVEVALARSARHRLAIAQRRTLEKMVTPAVVCFGETDVIAAVLRNERALISDSTFEQICERARSENSLQKLLACRKDLPLLVAFGMLDWVVEALHAFLYDRIGGEPAALKRILIAAVERAEVAETVARGVRERIERFIEKSLPIDDSGILDILENLPANRRDLKEVAVGDYLCEPLQEIRRVTRRGKVDRFARLCRAARVPKHAFERLCQHVLIDEAADSFSRSATLLAAVRSFENSPAS